MLVRRILKSFGILLFAGATVSMVAACAGKMSAPPQLHVEVFYLNRMALPEDAQVTVSLQDVSRADAPAILLDEKTISTKGKQVPIAATLNYDPAKIQSGHTYSVRASIKSQGKLIFTSTEHIPVKLDGTDLQPVKVRVEPVRH